MLNPEEGATNILLSISDATERRRKEKESDVLLGEMQHRMKNFLSLVQAIATQTTTEGRSAEEYQRIFLDRFQAMVRAHDLAFAEDGADLRALVVHAIAPYKTNTNALLIEESPTIVLPSASILSMHLLVHELATNAVKHGALAAPEGRVRVRWAVSPKGPKQLRFFWHEEGGPAVVQPKARNFGTRLIEYAARADLGGRAELNFKREGLQAEIVIPLM
jgi:two-component sensor histidine kinase